MKSRLDDAKSVAWFLARQNDVLRLLAIMLETRVLREAFNGGITCCFQVRGVMYSMRLVSAETVFTPG